MRAVIVIPARYGSTRFPGKPLARQTGKYLIEHVVEQARKARGAAEVVVATDDARIAAAASSFGARAVMTSAAHPSGTDRVAEVMRHGEFAGMDIAINVQGDEPEIDPAIIENLIGACGRPGVEMATVSAPFEHHGEVENPNIVKVVTDRAGFALYFSRAAIPFNRDGGAAGPLPRYHKHLGIYGYRREALLTLASSAVCDLERAEKLEQLRALYLGMRLYVHDAVRAPHGIDTPEDYAAFVKRYNATAGAPAAV
ncbi:MAG TPA: 3-deoxy-manno-octulosonate cytidylyltransferase [Phycisphaerae bacterium]|nr:3-deoxy-manno-octulosonate cytidylyltransferase [Phycisphaerae bacterium]